MARRSRGGAKVRAFIRNAQRAKSVKRVEVGFFASARYPDGTPVSNVAAWNEFGTEDDSGNVRIPERPFMRIAQAGAEYELLPILRRETNRMTMKVDRKLAGQLGTVMKGRIQRTITSLREPPNAEATVARKGSSNPLIDTGFMRNATTYVIVE